MTDMSQSRTCVSNILEGILLFMGALFMDADTLLDNIFVVILSILTKVKIKISKGLFPKRENQKSFQKRK